MFQRVVGAVAVLLMLGSDSSFADVPADHYFWQPAKSDGAPRPWAVLLPGTSGLDIFDDHEHYFRAALWLNERGVDALVIDYHGAIPLIREARDGPPGDRIATIVADALRTERAEGRMQENCPGAVIGWSLGGAAAWTLAAKPVDPALKAVAMFYPALLGRDYRNVVPILVLQGTADNVNPEDELRAFVANRVETSAPVEIVALQGAANFFDVPSLVPARTLHYPEPNGVARTFAYDAAAERSAHQALDTFLRKQGIAGGACARR